MPRFYVVLAGMDADVEPQSVHLNVAAARDAAKRVVDAELARLEKHDAHAVQLDDDAWSIWHTRQPRWLLGDWMGAGAEELQRVFIRATPEHAAE